MATSNPQMNVMLRKPAAVLCKRFQFGCKRLQILTTHMHSDQEKIVDRLDNQPEGGAVLDRTMSV